MGQIGTIKSGRPSRCRDRPATSLLSRPTALAEGLRPQFSASTSAVDRGRRKPGGIGYGQNGPLATKRKGDPVIRSHDRRGREERHPLGRYQALSKKYRIRSCGMAPPASSYSLNLALTHDARRSGGSATGPSPFFIRPDNQTVNPRERLSHHSAHAASARRPRAARPFSRARRATVACASA